MVVKKGLRRIVGVPIIPILRRLAGLLGLVCLSRWLVLLSISKLLIKWRFFKNKAIDKCGCCCFKRLTMVVVV